MIAVDTGSDRHACHRFPGTPTSIREARAWAIETAQAWGIDHAADDLALIVSELATNAIEHSLSGQTDGRFTVRLYLCPDRVRVVVRDGGPRGKRTPTRRTALPTAETGRGLALVEAFSLAWGALRFGTGVWAEVAR
ncbi:ATP-binding protein [Nocardiopsis sp. NPDC049922]|uniref:ATP-binding protein n=1 Tax=Nocardiopsis sp. NPDC049922 TaxID=3155157 RepID=UPI0033C8006D